MWALFQLQDITNLQACKLGPANFFDLRLTETFWKGKISIKGNVKFCATEPIYAVDRLAGKQIFRKVSRRPQDGYEPEMCTCRKQGQQSARLHYEKRCQQVKGEYPLFTTGEDTSGVLGPVLGSGHQYMKDQIDLIELHRNE